MIKLYGPPRSSAGRCYYCLEELNLTYEVVPVDLRAGGHKSPAYLELNPNGKVPVLMDGDFVIWESIAINLYLANTYAKKFLGNTPQETGLVYQWSVWSIAELQPPLITIFIQKHFVPEDKRDLKLIESSEKKIPNLLTVLNKGLSKNKFLAGNEFTLADVNSVTVVEIAKHIGFDLSSYPNILNWLKRIEERPAFIKYQKLANAH